MDKEFTYFYPIVTVVQTAFRDDGTSYVHGVDGIRQGHIVYQGRLMCGKTQDELKEGYGTKRHILSIRKFGPSKIHRRTFLKNFI